MENDEHVSFCSIRLFLLREQESAQFWIGEWIALGLAAAVAIQVVGKLIRRDQPIFSIICMGLIGLYTLTLSCFEFKRREYARKLLKKIEKEGNSDSE